MISKFIRPCCCMQRRTASFIVGIADVIIGIHCILATVVLLIQNLAEQRELENVEPVVKAQDMQELIAGFVLIFIACGIPATMTFFLGVFSIYATATGNKCLTAYSLALNLLLVVALTGIVVFLFCLGLRFSLFVVYVCATVLQLYFCLILHDFYKIQIRPLVGKSTRTSSPEEANLRTTKYVLEEL